MKEEKREEACAPEAGAPKVETLEEIEKEAKARKVRPKKKAKRRVGAPTLEERKAREAEEAEEAGAQLAMDTAAVKGMLEWIFSSLLAPRFGLHWKLEPDVAEAGGQAWAAVLNKYSPAASRFIEEIRAGMWTMGTVGPRWEKTKQIMAEEMAKKAEAEGGLTTKDEKPTGVYAGGVKLKG
ncbi:MAG: hypothetical protein HWN68_18325 [Desulfobacterales bacterium]|nr:hypothetical protein [Desulfobacterales bacterium]